MTHDEFIEASKYWTSKDNASEKKMKMPMHLLRVTPTSIDYLSSDNKKAGFDMRQHIDF